jgi:putative chitinase
MPLSGCGDSGSSAKEMSNSECDGSVANCPSPKAKAPCKISVQSETILTNPSNRSRIRIAVGEQVKIIAANANGSISWTKTGNSAMDSLTADSVMLKAFKQADKPMVTATDAQGCLTSIQFEVIDCCYPIKKAHLQTLFPAAGEAVMQAMTDSFNECYDKFFVDTCLRKAHFFAQVLQEAASGLPFAESLNYAADRLKRRAPLVIPARRGTPARTLPAGPFRYFWNHPREADRFGRIPETGTPVTQAADQAAIANRAYAERNGNGNIASGDGWRFRGRGYFQVTGRSNYSNVQGEIDLRFPGSGIDIVANADDMETVRGGMISAMAFWSMNNLHTVAERGDTDAVVDAVTTVINNGTERQPRRNNFHTARDVFQINNCPRKKD